MLKVIHLKKSLSHPVRILSQAVSTVVHGATLGTEKAVRTESTTAVHFNIAADQRNYLYCICYVSTDQNIPLYDYCKVPACSTVSSFSTVMQNRTIKR